MSIDVPGLGAWSLPTYELTAGGATNKRISAILNKALHVFEWHAERLWRSTYKEGFARRLSSDLARRPSLMRKILKLRKRPFTMVAYRAVEMLKAQQTANSESAADATRRST